MSIDGQFTSTQITIEILLKKNSKPRQCNFQDDSELIESYDLPLLQALWSKFPNFELIHIIFHSFRVETI